MIFKVMLHIYSQAMKLKPLNFRTQMESRFLKQQIFFNIKNTHFDPPGGFNYNIFHEQNGLETH